jgi:hypothetical protein
MSTWGQPFKMYYHYDADAAPPTDPPTPAPTEAPTVSPTAAPTPAPTKAPRSLPCYVETFQQTGCRRTVMWANSWWDSQPDAVVGNDMYAYCSLVSAGTASAWQQSFCCDGAEGAAADKTCGAGMQCTQQAELSCPGGELPQVSEERQADNYLHGCMVGAFKASGCNADFIAAGDKNWWVPSFEAGNNYTVYQDMYRYCLANVNSPTAEQRDTCGGRRGLGQCQRQQGQWEQFCPQPHKEDPASLRATFQATGCPNDYDLEGALIDDSPWAYLDNQYAPLWGYMSEEKVLDDMYNTCEALRTGYSTNQQRGWCCSRADHQGECGASITSCTRQTAISSPRRSLLEAEEATKAVYV